jgi:hypothetical protein
MQARPPRPTLENMLMARRENPGTGTGGAAALVDQIGQRPNMALPNSTPQTGMPQMPNSRQLVTGKDGKKYQVVIDPKTGLQTFIPYREPQRQANDPLQRGMPPMLPSQRGPAIEQMMGQGRPGGPPQGGGELMNRLRGLLSARG